MPKVNEYSLKDIRKQFLAGGVFYTPEAQARLLMDLLPSDITEIYDPTCGRGGLLRYYPDTVAKYGEEIDPLAVDDCKQILGDGAFIECTDVLANPKFTDKRFRAIIANPPFSVKWVPPADPSTDWRFRDCPVLPTSSRADWAFMLHILAMLDDDGVAVVICHPGSLYRGGREQKIREWFCDNGYIQKIIAVPPNTFTDTAIATNIVVLTTGKSNKTIEFTGGGGTAMVPVDEVRTNDYSLAVGDYVKAINSQQIATADERLASSVELLDVALGNFNRSLELILVTLTIEDASIRPLIIKHVKKSLDQVATVIDECKLKLNQME